MKRYLCQALLAAILILGWTHVYARGERLGEVNFPVSCNPEAQKQFQRAAALYHSFDWPRVTKAFQAVLEADPQCGMAWWGIALATQDNPFVWPISAKQVADGWAAIEKAKAIGAKTQRERDYIAALELFYKDGDKVSHRERALAAEEARERAGERARLRVGGEEDHVEIAGQQRLRIRLAPVGGVERRVPEAPAPEAHRLWHDPRVVAVEVPAVEPAPRAAVDVGDQDVEDADPHAPPRPRASTAPITHERGDGYKAGPPALATAARHRL